MIKSLELRKTVTFSTRRGDLGVPMESWDLLVTNSTGDVVVNKFASKEVAIEFGKSLLTNIENGSIFERIHN